MRKFLLMFAVAALLALDPAQSRAQYQYPVPTWYDQVPITMLPGWPPPQPRQVRGMFGDRVLGQSLRPKMAGSRFSSQSIVRDPSGAFYGIGADNRGSVIAGKPWQYAPPAQVRTPPVQPSAAQVVPEQPLPQALSEQPQAQTLPEQPLPEALREQIQAQPQPGP
jgi:hypothetical protein